MDTRDPTQIYENLIQIAEGESGKMYSANQKNSQEMVISKLLYIIYVYVLDILFNSLLTITCSIGRDKDNSFHKRKTKNNKE